MKLIILFFIFSVFCLCITTSSANSLTQQWNSSQYYLNGWLIYCSLSVSFLSFHDDIFPGSFSSLLSVQTICSLGLLHSCVTLEISFHLPSRIPLSPDPGSYIFILPGLIHPFWRNISVAERFKGCYHDPLILVFLPLCVRYLVTCF